MLKLIPRHHFGKLEAKYTSGRKARSFTRWSQLVHLLSMQLTALVSLRDSVSSLKARIKSLYHLGVKPVARSTFADANHQRPASFFAALFGLMYRRCQPLAPKHKFRFKNKLFSLDATVVSLCLTLPPRRGREFSVLRRNARIPGRDSVAKLFAWLVLKEAACYSKHKMPESKVKIASPYPALAAALSKVPRASGVYLFKDAAGKIIYIGKAVNLRNRVGSYLKEPNRHDPKTALMLQKMAGVDFIITASGREALILERNLIKGHRPRYNIMLRDDKNYLCLRLDLKEEFPSLRFVRRFNPDGAVYFGPFTAATMARETLKVMKEVFRVRTCRERRLAPRSRPCLEFQLEHCLGPCAGMVSAADYGQAVQEAVLFLKGKSRSLLKKLRAEMEEAAAQLDFERAAVLRDRLSAIAETLQRQDMARPSFRDQDVLGLARDQGQALIMVLVVRGGLVTGSREYFFAELPADEICWGPSSSSTMPRDGLSPTRCCSPRRSRTGGCWRPCSAKRKARRCDCWCPRRASGCGSWTWPPRTPGPP